MGEWKTVSQDLMRLLRFRTLPVALKLCETVEELEKVPRVRRPDRTRTLCQLITITRHWGWTMGASVDDFLPAARICAAMLGLCDRVEGIRNGTFRSRYWFKTREEAKKFEDSWPTIPMGRYKAILLAPLSAEKFDPDMVLIYGKPLQIILLINGIQYENYERFTFHCVGESSCADYIAQCYLTGKPSVSIPCWGEIRVGAGDEDEIVIALPGDLQLAKRAINGLEALSRPGGIRYPTIRSGVDAPIEEFWPEEYRSILLGKTDA